VELDIEVKNILLITTDQQRKDSLPCYGLSFLKTPVLDALAHNGIVFDNAISVAPQCQPCRASFISGQYPSSTGVPANFNWISEQTPSIAEAFNSAGWHTAAIGKMHFDPWDSTEGFSHRIIAEDKRHFFRPDHHAQFLGRKGLERRHPAYEKGYNAFLGAIESPLPKEFHVDAFIADSAVEYLETAPNEHVFCWVSFNSPHDPYDPPNEFVDLYLDAPIPEPVGSLEELDAKPKYQKAILEFFKKNVLYLHDYSKATKHTWEKIRQHYYASISFIDEQIGKILAVLEKRNLLDSTLIVFSSDHGDHLGDHGLPYKGTFYEGSMNVPLIIAGPTVTPNTRCTAFADWVDLHRTFLSIAGIDIPPHVQGEDLCKYLKDPTQPGRPVAFSELDGRILAYDGRYKLVICDNGEGELYDMEDTPTEVTNHFNEERYKDVQYRLTGEIARHLVSCNKVRHFGGGPCESDAGRNKAFEEIREKLSAGTFTSLNEHII
jgi:choline-sulfatase